MILRRISLYLLMLYALLTAFSIANTAVGGKSIPLLTPLITLSGFSFALVHALQREGWQRALRLLALVFGVSLLFESVGVATGWIYGPYHYSNSLGPKFMGLVPYLIPAAWFMMSYPSFIIADRMVPAMGQRWMRILQVAALGGVAMTAWDLVMDPVMSSAGHWVWDTNGIYFGIPLQNFVGWWFTIFVTYVLYQWISGMEIRSTAGVYDRQALLSYLITALGIVIITLITGIGNLSLIGLFAMLPWFTASWLKVAPVPQA